MIAGVGNIYACEALHRAAISPLRSAAKLGPARAERLAEAITHVLGAAIEAGGSSLRDFVQSDGSPGYFQHTFAVYDRAGETCPAPQVRGYGSPHCSIRTFDLLLSHLSEIAAQRRPDARSFF